MSRKTVVPMLCLLLIACPVTMAQEKKPSRFAFPDTIQLKAGSESRVAGTQQLEQGTIVVLFLRDRFGGGGYLQWPQVSMYGDGRWVHNNVHPTDRNITELMAVKVTRSGFGKVEAWKKLNRWDRIPDKEIQDLDGFEELGLTEVSVGN